MYVTGHVIYYFRHVSMIRDQNWYWAKTLMWTEFQFENTIFRRKLNSTDSAWSKWPFSFSHFGCSQQWCVHRRRQRSPGFLKVLSAIAQVALYCLFKHENSLSPLSQPTVQLSQKVGLLTVVISLSTNLWRRLCSLLRLQESYQLKVKGGDCTSYRVAEIN